MYALPALTLTAAEAVRAQFGPYEEPAPVRETGRRPHRVRVVLAAALDRASRAVAPPPRPAH
jgi:hypothetical protein